MRCKTCGMRLIEDEGGALRHVDRKGSIIKVAHFAYPDRNKVNVRNHWSDEKESK